LPDANPTPQPPPDGDETLGRLLITLRRYVVFPSDDAAVAVALWIAATHAIPAWQHATRLVINSPAKRCGKSRLLDIIAATCHRPLMSVSATVAAIYRSLGGDAPPTLIIDEADTIWGTKKQAEQNEDLRALINAGFQRGRPALRCDGPSLTPRAFPTFAMAALAGIGNMPDTITDRAVNIELRRRTSGEKVAQYRQRRDGPHLDQLRAELAAWAGTVVEALADAMPDMPVEDRAADTWEPLVAVADAAGGNWPALARSACAALTQGAAATDEQASASLSLLADIRAVFTEFGCSPFLSSATLVGELRKLEESPWAEYDLTARKLAQRLKPYGIASVRDTAGDVRGYRREDMNDAFSRYLASESVKASETTLEQRQRTDTLKSSDTSIRQSGTSDTSIRQTSTKCQTDIGTSEPISDALTLSDGYPQGNRTFTDCDACGVTLLTEKSRAAGRCAECRLAPPSAKTATCRGWLENHIAVLISAGVEFAESTNVYDAGIAAGYHIDNLRQAAKKCPDITQVSRNGRTAVWRLGAGSGRNEMVSAHEWLTNYLRQQTAPVLAAAAYDAGGSAGYSRDAIKAAALHPAIRKQGRSVATEWSLADEQERPA